MDIMFNFENVEALNLDIEDDTLEIQISDENQFLLLYMMESNFQLLHDELCRLQGVSTYSELEDIADDLRDKLMVMTDKYKELKEAYEELKRR